MRKATAFRGGANKTAPPCFPKAVNSNLVTVPAEQLQRNITLQKSLLLGKTVFHIRQKGVPPLLLPASVLQLPLKPYLSLQPSDFEGNCDSSDFLLDFRCSFSYSFYLLRKCGLLAHTSAAFLKNCCTEKLFICLRLVLAKIMAFFTTFTQFSLTPISRNVIILMFIERTNFDEPSNKIAIFNRRNFYEKRF